MVKVYGSLMCPDCRECKVNFDADGVKYEFVDINESIRNMKAFIGLRDNLAVFDCCKQSGSIGIPAIVKEDGSVTLDWEEYLCENCLPIVYKENGKACSLDHKEC